MRSRRSSLIFGLLCSALAASILAVRVPHYAIFAAAALIVVLAIWVVVLARGKQYG